MKKTYSLYFPEEYYQALIRVAESNGMHVSAYIQEMIPLTFDKIIKEKIRQKIVKQELIEKKYCSTLKHFFTDLGPGEWKWKIPECPFPMSGDVYFDDFRRINYFEKPQFKELSQYLEDEESKEIYDFLQKDKVKEINEIVASSLKMKEGERIETIKETKLGEVIKKLHSPRTDMPYNIFNMERIIDILGIVKYLLFHGEFQIGSIISTYDDWRKAGVEVGKIHKLIANDVLKTLKEKDILDKKGQRYFLKNDE